MRALHHFLPACVGVLLWSVIAGLSPTAADAQPSDPAQATPRRLLLPPLVAVYAAGVWKIRKHGDWTATAEPYAHAELAEAARAQGWIVPAELTSDERARLREFQMLAYTVADRARDLSGYHDCTWNLARFDGNLGTSLTSLAERFGTAEAVGVVGLQVEQGKSAVGTQAVLLAGLFYAPYVPLPAFTGTTLLGYAVDLRTGQMHWCEFEHAKELIGINTGDLRKPKSARRLYRSLVESLKRSLSGGPYPAAPGPSIRASHWATPAWHSFRVHVPAQWNSTLDERSVTATRDGRGLNEISVRREPHKTAFSKTKQATSSESTPDQLREWYAAELLAQDLPELQIVESSSTATLVNQPAARVRYVYRPWADAPLRENIVLLTATDDGLLSAMLSAPQLAYFERALPDFETMAASVTSKGVP